MKHVVVFGNCQADNLVYLLSQVRELQGRYSFKHHFVQLPDEEWRRLAPDALQADIYFAQDVAEWERYPLVGDIRPETPIIRFPYAYLAALWPFDAHQNGPDYRAASLAATVGPNAFPFQDRLLARLRDEVPDPERRYEAYRDLDVSDVPRLPRYLQAELARLRRSDARLGTTAGAFIAENFRKQRLFHTITHPTVSLLQVMADDLLARIGETVDWKRQDYFDKLGIHQVPLHPRVISEFAIEWAGSESVYRFLGREMLTFEAYQRRYIETYG